MIFFKRRQILLVIVYNNVSSKTISKLCQNVLHEPNFDISDIDKRYLYHNATKLFGLNDFKRQNGLSLAV